MSNNVKIFSKKLPEHFVAWLQKHPMYLPSVSKITDMGDGSALIEDADLDNDPEDTVYCVTDPTTGLTNNLPNKTTTFEEIALYEERLHELMFGTNNAKDLAQDIPGEERTEIRLKDLE